MIRYKLFIYVMLAGVLMSCNDNYSNTDMNSSEIRFDVIGISRGAINNVSDLKNFNVWGVTDNDERVCDGSFVEFKDNTWVINPVAYWQFDKTFKFYAATGYNDVEVDFIDDDGAGRKTLTIDVGEDELSNDLMTAKSLPISYDSSQTPEPVSLNFKHEKAQVTLNIKTDNNVTGVVVSSIQLYNFYKGGKFIHYFEKLPADVYDGAWDFSANTKGSIEKNDNYPMESNQSYTPISELLIPAQGMSGVTILIKYKIGNVDFSETFDLSKCSGGGNWLEAGVCYNLSFIIRPDGISFGGIVEEPWKESHSGGDINIGI